MSKQKIVSIEIELKDYEPIKFTMDEAKELYEQLHSLFGEKVKHVHHHDWWRRPYYTYYIGINSSGQPYLANTTVSSDKTKMKVSYNTNGVDLS